MAVSTKALLILAAAGALLGGCASMSESECRSADWYQLGYRDADPYGQRPQIDRYAYQCHAWVTANEPEYMRGWQEGYWEYSHKMNGSECCGGR
jgi:hypothetical protein